MERIVMKSQAAKTFLLLSFLSLLILTPFISASLRSSYLYFLLNLLIILLALEAGLLASISKPNIVDDIKKPPPPLRPYSSPSTQKLNEHEAATMAAPLQQQQQLLLQVDQRVQMLKRCRSKPSIFFIGSSDEEEDQQQEAVQVEEKVAAAAEEERVGDLMSKQELFTKAEMFIGNFYKQLKMQSRDQSWREHSWALP